MAKPMPTLPPEGEKIAELTPDDLALEVEGRAARVAAVDRRVDLQEVVVGAAADLAAGGRDDAGGDRAAEAERVADRDHGVADAHLAAVAESDVGQGLVGLDLEQGQVGLLVDALERRRELGAVVERDGDLVGAAGDMGVGDDQAVGADDEARALAALALLGLLRRPHRPLALALLAEEALEEAAHLGIRHRALGHGAVIRASRSTRTLTTAGLTAATRSA